MLEYIKSPNTWVTITTVVISVIALFQNAKQTKLSNKHQLFDRRLSKYLEFNIIYSLYIENKKELKDNSTFYDTNDLIFLRLTNCSELEQMVEALSSPLQQDKQNVLLTKCEEMHNSAIEISMIFDGEVATVTKEFISLYANLLKSMYQQQVYISKIQNNKMPLSKEIYDKKCIEMARKLGLYKTRDRLEELSKVIVDQNIIEKMKKELRLTR